MTRVFLFHSLKLSQRSKDFAAVRGNVQVRCTRIGHMLREHIGLGCAGEVSQHVSLDMVWSPEKGSADGVGSLSAPWGGYTAFADCAFGMSDEQTSIRRSFRSLAHSSVGGTSRGFVRRSKAPNKTLCVSWRQHRTLSDSERPQSGQRQTQARCFPLSLATNT